MVIPQSKIEEIRQAANIVDVISNNVQLRKRGKNFLGLCPFHTEKTPSFTVNEEKQIFRCFGCGIGGNVFKYIMEYDKLSFVEAVKELAEQYGINIEYEKTVYERPDELEVLYELNSLAGKYFSDNLLNKPEGEPARNYFQKRRIKLQYIKLFGLGYALPGRDNFVEVFKKKKLDIDKGVQLGLIGKTNDGKLYDKFAGRLIFPIFSAAGRVAAFAGRVFEQQEGTAKYLNSPESLVYYKSRILYGLSHSKDDIRKLDRAILVEGYMDLISLFQSGIKNVVAVSGTSLTDEQIQLLSRYTKNVVLLFDADTAGIKASMRSIELLLKRDMEIKIASLPSGEDPDSYVNNYGKEQFEEIVGKAQNFLEYQTGYFFSKGYFDDAAKTAEAIRELVKPVSLISDELKQALLIKSIAQKFNLREKLLESELEKFLSRNIIKPSGSSGSKTGSGKLEFITEDKKREKDLTFRIEKDLIKLLLEGKREIIEFIKNFIETEDYIYSEHARIAAIVYNSLIEDKDLITGSLIENFEDEQLRLYVINIAFEKYSISNYWDERYPAAEPEIVSIKSAKDTVKKFKLLKFEDKIAEVNKSLGEQTLDEKNAMNILKDINEQRKQFLEVFND